MKASFFTESILYWLARGVSFTACRLPAKGNVTVGRWVGSLLFWLLAHRRSVALRNLKAAFGSSRTPAEYHRILRGVFEHLGMTFMEIARIPRIDRAYIERWVEVPPETKARFEAALAQGKGLVILTAHFGNWELLSLTAALHGYPVLVLAREQGWPRLNRLLVEYRESKGCQVVSKGFPIRTLIRGLQEGRAVGILSDQDGGRNGMLTDFLGRIASTAAGAIALALNAGCPVLPVVMVRRRGPLHTLRVGEPLSIPSEGSLPERIERGLKGYLAFLEEAIRQHPDQWLWLHRRWKSSPERRVLLFSDGKAGHLSQMKAFCQRLQAAWNLRQKEDRRLDRMRRPLIQTQIVPIQFRHPALRLLIHLVASFLPVKFPLKDLWLKLALADSSYRTLSTTYADIAVSCGASTAGVNLLWSWANGARAVHITRTRWPSIRRFHLGVIPRHDLSGRTLDRLDEGFVTPRLLVVDGALALPNEADPSQIQRWRQRLGILGESATVGLLLGGPTKGIRFKPDEVERILEELLTACDDLKAQLLVTSSRRTPPKVEEILRWRLTGHPRLRLLVLVNQGDSGGLDSPEEAIPCILGLSDALVVSGDSISMVSEAVATDKPVVAFLGASSDASKYHRFLTQMDRKGKLTFVCPGEVAEELIRTISVGAGFPFGSTGFPAEPCTFGNGTVVGTVEVLARWL